MAASLLIEANRPHFGTNWLSTDSISVSLQTVAVALWSLPLTGRNLEVLGSNPAVSNVKKVGRTIKSYFLVVLDVFYQHVDCFKQLGQ